MSLGFLGSKRLERGPWQAFERSIARLLAHSGWDSYEVVGKTGDKGADVIAVKGNDEYVFQVKYTGSGKLLNRGNPIVKDVKRAMRFYVINKGICVSNTGLNTNLLKDIATLNKVPQYYVDFMDKNTLLREYNALPEWANEKKTPYPYQDEAIDAITSSYLNKEKGGLVCLATGLGKTFVAASFLKWYFENNMGNNVLVLAHLKSLILQFEKSIWKSIPKTVSTHICHGKEKPSYFEGVTLSTFQSFSKLARISDIEYDLVIVDEAHHAPAATYIEIIDKISPNYILGLTATPFRTDKQSVLDVFGKILYGIDIVEALQKGYLSKINYRLRTDNIDKNWVYENSRYGHTIKKLNKKIFIKERDKEIVSQILESFISHKRQRGIIFCNSTLHAQKIENLLRARYNFSARSLTSKNEDDENYNRLRKFTSGEIKILTVYDMLNEGVDVPDIDFLAYLRVTHSRIIFLQQLGRGLRYKDNKTLIVLDYVSDLRRIATLKNLKRDLDEVYRSKDVEEIEIKDSFKLDIFDEETYDFLNLVTADIMHLDDMDEQDKVQINNPSY